MEGYSIDTLKYKKRMLDFCSRHHVSVNLDCPQTIQEKLCWLNIYDTNPLKTKCADKVLLHDYSVEKLGKDICIPIIKTYDNVDQINWDELPKQFVIKCNHGSGMNIIVKDKSKLNKKDAESKLKKWMETDFAFCCGFESHYHDINRKILVEEYKSDGHHQLLDYKFLCFNGKPKYVLVIGGRGQGQLDIQYYDMDFKLQSIKKRGTKRNTRTQKKPQSFELMKEYAEKLSQNFKFVRVDFYDINGSPYLGELTFTPKAMCFRYVSSQDEIRMGNLLDLGVEFKPVLNKTKNRRVLANTKHTPDRPIMRRMRSSLNFYV